MTTEQDPLEHQVKEALEQQAQALDAASLTRLRQARAQALAELQQGRDKPPRLNPGALWGGGFAAAALVLVLVWPGNRGPLPEFTQEIADLELLADANDIELYEELEFYLWLEQQEAVADDV